MERFAEGRAGNRNMKTTLGCLFMMGFEGTTINPHIQNLIEEYRLGAVLLKATNFVSAEQAITLIKDLQITAHNAHHEHPLLIAVDQENGLVKSIADSRWITQFPPALGIAATGSAENAYQVALATGRELSCLGVNWILGPALDVVLDRSAPGFGSRSFGDDPEEVARLGSAYIKGMKDAGVVSLAKHFPLGGSLKFDESSTTVPVVFETLEQLRQKVLIPFQEAIKVGVNSMMAAGCAISSIGPKFMHACFSRKVVTDLLRHQLGYTGVVVSECLEMESIANHIGVGQATVMGVHAGCDILTICQSLPLQLEAITSLSLALKNGALSWDLVQKSADRVMSLRSAHTSWSHALNPPGLARLAATRSYHKTLASRVYEESITIIRDEEHCIPLSNTLSERNTLLVLSPILNHRALESKTYGTCHQAHSKSGDVIQYGEDYFQDFGRALACYNIGEILHTSYTSHGVRAEHERLIERADAVLILVADANRNQYQMGFAKHVAALCKLQRWTEAISGSGKRLILVSLSSAYDIPLDAPFPTHVCTYDSSATAMHCLARVLGGDITPSGQVPGSQKLPAGEKDHDIAHQQAWLVEEFSHDRDRASFRNFLHRMKNSHDDQIIEFDEYSLPTKMMRGDSYKSFVIRNTSTNAIYGFACAFYFSRLNRGVLGALLVDPERRDLSIGRDLHTSIVRYLAQISGIETIQLGAPIFSPFPGLGVSKDTELVSSASFFQKLSWKFQDDVTSQKFSSMTFNYAQQSQTYLSLIDEAEANGLEFERIGGEASWREVLSHVQKSSSLNDRGFSNMIYEEASLQESPPYRILARETESRKLAGSLLLLSRKNAFASSFPSILSLLATAGIIMYPVVSPELLDSSKLKTVLRGLLAFALQEAKILEYSSCFIYALTANMRQLISKDFDFVDETAFITFEQKIEDFK